MTRLARVSVYCIVLLITIWMLGCSTEDPRTSVVDNVVERTFFTEYRDTLVKLDELNKQLQTDFKTTSLGKPIGISGTDYWLITVGGWKLNDRNILLQGTALEEGNSLYPSPLRNTEVEFTGPFAGLIRFRSESNAYDWIIEPGIEMGGMKYQRTMKYHLIVLSESNTKLEFLEITSNKRFDVIPERKIVEWAVNDASDQLILMLDEGWKMKCEQLSIEKLVVNG